MSNNTPAMIVIVGETGSGKSSLAMSIAQSHSGEIIAADSRTIYKGFDVGTAKPSKADRELVSHHLLDVIEPHESFSAAQFKSQALSAIADINERGALPIMVGGTGLYVDSVIFDFEFGAKADALLRKKLNNLTDQDLVDEVQRVENTTGNKFMHGASTELWKNRRHMIRFIETGQHVEQEKVLRPNTLVIGMQRSRTQMRKRIEGRVEQMFRAGLRKEIDDLVAQYGWDNMAMGGIIYRLFKSYHDGEISMTEVKRQFVKKDLQYAKRQRTWFKRNPHIQWFDKPELAMDCVDRFMSQ